MFKNILKISLALCLLAVVTQAGRKTQLATHLVDEFPDKINVSPFVRVGNKLYHFGESKATWFKASLRCRALGGFLASFDSQKEMAALSNYTMTKYPTDRWWWISGSDIDVEGDFFWYSTGERIAYADWSRGQPDNAGGNEDCVMLWFQKTKYQMNDWVCKQRAFYICEADKPKTVAVSIY